MTPSSGPLPAFPSAEFFDELVLDAVRRPEEYERLGFADCRLVIEVVDPPRAARRFGLVLDGYDIRSEGEITDPGSFGAEVVVSGPLDTWTEMLASIAEHGSADRAHTLNALSIAGFPLATRSDDPIGRDKFYRYAETLQTLFDSAGTRVPAGG